MRKLLGANGVRKGGDTDTGTDTDTDSGMDTGPDLEREDAAVVGASKEVDWRWFLSAQHACGVSDAITVVTAVTVVTFVTVFTVVTVFCAHACVSVCERLRACASVCVDTCGGEKEKKGRGKEGKRMPVLAGSWVREAMEMLMAAGDGRLGLGGITVFIFRSPFSSSAPDSSSTRMGSRSARSRVPPSGARAGQQSARSQWVQQAGGAAGMAMLRAWP